MKRSEFFLMILQVPLDFLLLLCAGISAYVLRFTDWAVAIKPVSFDLTLIGFLDVIIPVAIGWIIIFSFAGLYSIDPNKKLARDLGRVFFACATGLAMVAVYVMIRQQLFDSRFLVLAGWGFAVIYISCGRILMRGIKAILYRGGIGLRRIAVIGAGSVADTLLQTLKERKELGYQVVSHVPHFSNIAAKKLAEDYLDEVVFVNPRANEKETLQALQFCNRRHITFKYSADLFATLSAHTRVVPLAGIPIVELRRARLDGWGQVVKRFSDILFSAFFLILGSSIMLFIAIGILCETGRPVIYKNERIGLRGWRFFTFKFRSMHQKDSTGIQFGTQGKAAEEREVSLIQTQNARKGPIYKIANDPRVTPFGRFLRRWSLDELPQLWNVLIGDMSLVGPRPHQPREVAQYHDTFPHIFALKPGITGLAQISGRSDLSFEEEMNLDVLYLEKWHFMLDFIILLKTPFILFKKRTVE